MLDNQHHTTLQKLLRLATYVLLGIVFSVVLSSALLKPLYGINLIEFYASLSDNSELWLPGASRFLAGLQQMLSFFIPGLIFYLHYRNRTKKLMYSEMLFLYIVALNILSIPLVEFAFYINQFFPESWLNDTNSMSQIFIDQMISEKTFWAQSINIIVLCVLPAIGEELVFRFGLQKHVLSKTRLGIAGSVIVTSLVFSIVHFEMSAFLPRFVLALILGTSYVYSRTLLVPIMFHMFNNYLAFTQMQRGSTDSIFPSYFSNYTYVSVIVVVLCTWLVYKIILAMGKSVHYRTTISTSDYDGSIDKDIEN